jgi:hypothetical protein
LPWTEVLAVVDLSRNDYTDFEVVLAWNDKKAVDFTARRSGKRVRVEVKNLRLARLEKPHCFLDARDPVTEECPDLR